MSSLGNWVRQALIYRGEKQGLTSEERSELVRLRREKSKLMMERSTRVGAAERSALPMIWSPSRRLASALEPACADRPAVGL